MGHDGLFIIRKNGHDRWLHDGGWGSGIDSLLLLGPDRLVAQLQDLRPVANTYDPSCLSGAAFVDLDARRLLYWANQFFWHRGRYLSEYDALLTRHWPGFSHRWASAVAADFAAALGHEMRFTADVSAVPLPDPMIFERASLSFPRTGDAEYLAWLAELGEAKVREVAESDQRTWIIVRGEEWLYGRCEHPAYELERLARCGPELSAIVTQVKRPLQSLDAEDQIREWLLIDHVAAEVVWHAHMPPFGSALPFCAPRWPGFTYRHEPRGLRGLEQRTGLRAERTPRDKKLRELRECLRSVGQAEALAEELLEVTSA